MKQQSFGAKEIEIITDIKRARLQRWLESGYVSPSIQVATGHGTRNLYSAFDGYKIKALKTIIDAGIKRRVASNIVNKINRDQIDTPVTIAITKNISIIFYPLEQEIK